MRVCDNCGQKARTTVRIAPTQGPCSDSFCYGSCVLPACVGKTYDACGRDLCQDALLKHGPPKPPEPEYVPFGPVATGMLKEQCQYAARDLVHPDLGRDIRWKGKVSEYHDITIHPGDVDKFVKRVKDYQTKAGIRDWSKETP